MHCELQDGSTAPRILETNVNDLWAEEPQPDEEPVQEPASSMTAVSSTFDALSLAQHSCANIQHKAFIGLFVPHNRLLSILEGLKMVPSGALRYSKQSLSKLSKFIERSDVLTCRN
jgi:hypothetical protein